MKILAINGSPKGDRSNTWKLTKRFLEGMREGLAEKYEDDNAFYSRDGETRDREPQAEGACSGEVWAEETEIQEIQVSRLEIRPCLGCFSCWDKTPGNCCIQDDMREVIQKLLWADVTVWSFPLYYYSVPGGLKNLIDRQLPMMLPFMVENEAETGSGSHPSRYDMSGKRSVLISTCGFYSAEGNYDGVHSLFGHLCGREAYTAIFCGQGELFRVPELSRRTEGYLEHVRQAGREYVRGGIRPETKEKLGELLYPREVFESMADASWGIDKETGGRESDALVFTRQMAALYRRENYPGKDIVLEMCYTDLDECYQVILGKEGSRVVTDGFGAATTRIETPFTVWQSISRGEIRGDEALMKHLYRVKGDFSLMLNWEKYFGGIGAGEDAQEASGAPQGMERRGKNGEAGMPPGTGTQGAVGVCMPRKGTNMNILLIPWIVFWAAVPIDSRWGSLASLAVCMVMPLLSYRSRKTFYDLLSAALVAGFAVLSLLGAPERLAVPLAYLSFGIMWTASCTRRIPLTAYYSMNQYNGEDALRNPMFLKTNRILTLLWGILYLLTPSWTYAVMGTGAGAWIGAINSVLPALMGVFTMWFQKWYPAKIARG